MSVYIDSMNAKYGRMRMCHMIADTEDELHEMADSIGVAGKWYQSIHKASFPHYDVALSKKRKAIESGAVEVDRRQLVSHMRRIKANIGAFYGANWPDEELYENNCSECSMNFLGNKHRRFCWKCNQDAWAMINEEGEV